jgi:hypothetical protein
VPLFERRCDAFQARYAGGAEFGDNRREVDRRSIGARFARYEAAASCCPQVGIRYSHDATNQTVCQC